MGHRDSIDPFDPYAKDGGPKLELDLGAPGVPRRGEGGRPNTRPVPVVSPRLREREMEPEEPDEIPARAAELAHYGRPPSVFLEIPYAIGLYRRRRALRAKLPELRRVRDLAEKELEVATLELGRALHAERAHPRAKEIGTPLRVADATRKLLDEHEAELASAKAEARAEIARIEATMATANEAVRPMRARAQELQSQIVVYQREFEAISKVIHDAGVELAAMEKSGVDDADKRIELEARRTLRRADAEAPRLEIEARTPELTQLQAKIGKHEKSLAKSKKAIEEIQAKLARVEERVAVESADARAAYERALRDLADGAVEQRLDFVIVPTAARLARLRYDTHFSHARELENHEIALTLEHPASRKRGWAMLGLLVVGLVGWLLHRVAG